jgi:hypothetical protein
VHLADVGHIGFREVDPEVEARRRIETQVSIQKHVAELLKDDRIKPTVSLPMQEGAQGSHEEGSSPDLREESEDSESEEPPPPPKVTPAKKAIETLEIIAAEKAKLDERDARRKARHEAIQAKIHRPPQTEETPMEIKPMKKKKPPEPKQPKRKAKQSEDGQEKQRKAELRTNKGTQ